VQVICFSNQFGPAQVWCIDGSDVPPSAMLPGPPDQRARVIQYKGPGVSWETWCKCLASATPPSRGTWGLEEVPDGTDAQEALNIVRQRALASL
jgi:hypothetical protein